MGMSNEQLEQALKAAVTRLTNAMVTRKAVDSFRLEGKTLNEVMTYVLGGTAANADKFAGKTYEEIIAELTGEGSLLESIQNSFNAFVARRDNPHGVTKAQVGLGSVENYGIASSADAAAGVADKYMTPALTKEVVAAAISALVGSAPGTLDTLQEIADAIQQNGDIIDQLVAQIASKETPAGAQAKADDALARAKAYTDEVGFGLAGIMDEISATLEGPI